MITYGEVKKIDILNFYRKIFHVSELVLNAYPGPITKTVEGNSFLYFTGEWQYGHVLQDMLGHYEFLKQYVPDLQLIIVAQNHQHTNDGNVIAERPVIQNIIDRYPDSIFVKESDKVLIKNIYYLFSIFMPPIKDVLETNTTIFGQNDPDFAYQYWAVNFIKNKFKTDEEFPKKRKLYISRAIADSEYPEKYSEYLNKIRILENYKLLEDYMESIGYEIVTNEGLTIEEQAKLYKSASHIVAINGTGGYNTIFCDPGTKIFFLNIHSEFGWFFDLLIEKVTENTVTMVPKLHPDQPGEGYKIIAEQLIECLKSYEDVL